MSSSIVVACKYRACCPMTEHIAHLPCVSHGPHHYKNHRYLRHAGRRGRAENGLDLFKSAGVARPDHLGPFQSASPRRSPTPSGRLGNETIPCVVQSYDLPASSAAAVKGPRQPATIVRSLCRTSARQLGDAGAYVGTIPIYTSVDSGKQDACQPGEHVRKAGTKRCRRNVLIAS